MSERWALSGQRVLQSEIQNGAQGEKAEGEPGEQEGGREAAPERRTAGAQPVNKGRWGASGRLCSGR